jgi:hypothetical protein
MKGHIKYMKSTTEINRPKSQKDSMFLKEMYKNVSRGIRKKIY